MKQQKGYRVWLLRLLFVNLVIGFFAVAALAQSVTLKGNWNPIVKLQLEKLIAAHAGQGKICIFDFDNTTLCRDIGEATMAALNQAGVLTKEKHNKCIDVEFDLKGKKISMATVKNLPEYYEDFLSATKHHALESTPYENGYGWVVQIMAPMSPADWLPYTEKAFGNGIGEQDSKSPDLHETKINGYRMPFFYPEMVDLYGVLLKNGYKVYISSASNVHTVRWMVLNQLNPRIQALHGKDLAIPPENVIGISCLMNDDRTGKLCKDPYLVRENKKYAYLDKEELSHYHLTPQICHPMNGYYGKLANIMKYITKQRPFLIGGDSSNDLPMLNYAENRIWITRLEKMGYQKTLVKAMGEALPGQWFIQPVLYKKAPGFVSTESDLDRRLAAKPDKLAKAKKVVEFLRQNGALPNF
ncbi:MAG: haloacid dehalogenase-like hydrolase [Deltaproteobacteria bacterium]|nr:haloacid dehalogenase-like hydrolase [Deltaproteobacteria bacterium]